ncbi:AmmeMemoRadiSam system radical SAM enzyme [Candidatus Woesearchaeota archaeon]|nr:AmmeMemoRadiSam system radical SAM enzyme [Candidatus Woesearchaeota archaeon]
MKKEHDEDTDPATSYSPKKPDEAAANEKGGPGSRHAKKEKDKPAGILNKNISRRDFIKFGLIGIGGISAAAYGYGRIFKRDVSSSSRPFRGGAPDSLWKWSREAYHYTKHGMNVQCNVCPNRCSLEPGDRSICRNKVNIGGKLYTVAYGNPCSAHVDPIEKKPLFHFLPSSSIFSIATSGCSFRCLNCQNWTISQFQPEETKNYDMMPPDVVRLALENKTSSIAYTYSEPTTFYEYMHDTSALAKKQGLKNVWVTNGYINEKPLRELCRVIDAANIDLKSFDEKTYNKLNSGSLKPVLSSLKTAKEENIWVEITNLVIPSWTDDIGMIRDMASWLHKNGFDDCPLHFSRFHPQYKLAHLPPTPAAKLDEARKTAMEEGLKFVYIGNVPGSKAESTYCPRCGKTVIGRRGYTITENNLENNLKHGVCRFCGEKIAGIWGF